MAAGVSINDAMLLPLLLMALLGTLALPLAQSVAFTSTSGTTNFDPFSNYTCPNECVCYKMNESSPQPTAYANCTIPYFSSHLTNLIKLISNPLTSAASFTCSYDGPAPDSFLWDGAFQQVTQLHTLIFNNCKFKSLDKDSFRGLSTLIQLYIRDAAIADLDPYLLAYIPRLEFLEISYSSLSHLFPLCDARSLRVLNISGNHLVSLDNSGLHCPDSPLTNLETLDATRNFITKIPAWLGQSLPNLYVLGVADNYVSSSEDAPFKDLKKLMFLDVSNNSFTSFNRDFFRGCTSVHVLGLSANQISSFPVGIFQDLSVLRQLELAEMGLDDNVWMEILELRQLGQLNMTYNKLTSININAMSQFLRMEVCLLSHNNIRSLQKNTFYYQYQLQTLDLSYNEIPEIPSEAFQSQDTLQHLHLQWNNITTIGYDAFANLEELLTFDISYNSIVSLPSKAFDALGKVTYIDLSSNSLTVLDDSLFSNTLWVSYLNISHNQLVDVKSFHQLQSLKVIDLSHNNISFLDPVTFMDLHELTTVYLNHNNMQILPMKLFKGCENLKTIDISYNSLKLLNELTFDSDSKVESIDLSYNDIIDIGNVFSGLKDLQILNLSYNKITRVLRNQFPHFIEHINLRGNEIEYISAHTFKSLNKIRTVDLSGNQLTTLDRMDVEIAFGMSYSPLFKLDFNPFACDCHLGWLKDWFQGKLKDTPTLPTFKIGLGSSCSNSFYPEPQKLQYLARSEFLCNYTNHCEESCMCCGYDGCYCKYRCPSSCQCYIGDDYWHVHQVQCNSASLTAIPTGLPEGATDLRLDGNNIQILQRHAFLALKHVVTLYLNHSQIHTIQNNTFKGLKSVKRLFLNDNYITAIYSVTFKGLESLEELYLYNNDIFVIDNEALLRPPFLTLVNLQGNSLVTISVDELWRFTNRSVSNGYRTKLYLSGNPWNCDVDFICKMLQFVQSNSDSVEDVTYMECIPSGTTEKPHHVNPDGSLLLDLQPGLCGVNLTIPDNITRQSVEASTSKTETYALIAACVVVVFFIVLLIVTYVNRHLLQVLCFTRFGCRVFKMAKASDDNERPYDAFISYSNKDEDFVIRQLAPRLENGDKKFKLCVHYRDFPVGACIAETIVRSVEASKRTILVVSDNFLDSEWCRFEFQTAHQQVLNERRNRVILILMHDLDSEKLDSTLKVYMRTKTYLKYDDPWFWEKLMFAMPDIRHRKTEMPSRLPSSRDLEYMARDRSLTDPHHHPMQTHTITTRNGSRCETIHNDMYEIPVLDTGSIHYQLANGVCCSTHTNSAYHNSDGSDSTSGFHNGSVCGSCGHYEECGPGSSSIQSTPQKLMSTPPPVPSIPKEGFVPRDRLNKTVNV